MQKIEKLLRTLVEPARRACKGVWEMSQPCLCIYTTLKIIVYYSQAFSKEKLVSLPWRGFENARSGLSDGTWNLVTCLTVVVLSALTSEDLTSFSGVWDRILRSLLGLIWLIQVRATSQAFKLPQYLAHAIYRDVYLCLREETARFTLLVPVGALLANQTRIF